MRKGLLLILNDGNLLHTAPIVFMNLVARVLHKKAAGEPNLGARND